MAATKCASSTSASMIVWIAMLMFVGPASSASGTISDDELGLSGVALGDTEASVRSRLGSPKEQRETGEATELEYAGLTVSVGWLEQKAPNKQRRVWQLKGTGKAACTPAGICPGMAFERARAAYGAPLVAQRETGTVMEYPSRRSSCWLQLDAPAGVIRSISAVCQP